MKAIITTICLLGSFGLLLFIWPEYQELRESMARAEVKEQDLENLTSYIDALNEMSARISSDYESDIEKMKDGIPDDHYIPSLFSELRRVSHSTGVRIERLGDFSQSEIEERAGLNEIEVSFTVQGGYSNFKNFILELEKNARIINLEAINIESTGSEDSRSLEYRVTILTYSY